MNQFVKWIKHKIIQFIVNNFDEIESSALKIKEKSLRQYYSLPNSFKFGDLSNISFLGKNITIGDNTYFNSGRINAGAKSKIIIGEWCAIGYNVNIIAKSHDIMYPTGDKQELIAPEKDIIIGDYVWIGSNVFIKEGISIGSHSIIGANSVVTKDIETNSVVAGVPAKLLYFKH